MKEIWIKWIIVAVAILLPFTAQATPITVGASGVGSTSLGSGTYSFSETDLSVSARSIPMVWERTYRSNRVMKKDGLDVFGEPGDGPLGYGWMTPWFMRIEDEAFVNEQGRYFYFEKDSNDNYLPDMKSGYILRKVAAGYEILQRGSNTFIFDNTGKLTAIKDPRGNTASLVYDANGRLTVIKDVMSRTIFTLAYNADGRIESITDIGARRIDYGYDEFGNLTTVTYGVDVLASYTYNSNHGITSKANALGETYTIDYYHADRGIVKSILDPVGTELKNAGEDTTGHKKTFIYDFENKVFYTKDFNGITYKTILNKDSETLLKEEIIGEEVTPTEKTEVIGTRTYKKTDALGNSTIEQRDEWGNKTKWIDAEGNEWRYTYNNQSKLLTITDPLGTITKYEYDQYGNEKKETVALGTNDESFTSYMYNQFNEIISVTKGATTEFKYDNGGNLTEIKDPLGHVISMEYDTVGNLLSNTRPLAGSIKYEEYNLWGSPERKIDLNGNITSFEYDLLGRIKTQTRQADNAITQYFYTSISGSCQTCGGQGGIGKIDYIIYPEGDKKDYDYDNNGKLTKLTDDEGNTINYTYDPKGNLIKEEIKDPSENIHKTVSYEYDLMNRRIKQQNSDGYWLYTYDLRGNIASIKDPNGNVTTYVYDPVNRLVRKVQPGSIITRYTYDRRGNLKSVLDANSSVTAYEYDSRNKIIRIASPDAGITLFTYDLNGNVETKTDAKGIMITSHYDAANRLKQMIFPDATMNIIYDYDNCTNGKGKLCKMTESSGVTDYEYSHKGQIIKETKVVDAITYIMEYDYDKNGNLKTIKYPSGRVITYNYDNNKIRSVLNNAETIATDIAYKPFGGMKSLTYGNNLHLTIGYDSNYRLTSIITGSIQNLIYTPDPNGNITAITDNLDASKSRSFGYDDLNRLTNATGPWGVINYTYDGAGNRLTETTDSGMTTYTYTANRLDGSTGEKSFTFDYDPNGNTVSENTRQYIYNQNQRLIKSFENGILAGEYVYNGNGQRIKKTTESGAVIFHYDLQGKIIAESTQAGSFTAEYVFLNGAPLAEIESGIIYYHNDNIGTPQKMTDGSAAIAWEEEFLPFGEELSIAGNIINNLRFSGQYYDEETGMHYNYFRDYSPMLGRYVETDPVGIQKGKNHLYGYAENNPLINTDPLGLVVGAGFGGALVVGGGLSGSGTLFCTKTCDGLKCCAVWSLCTCLGLGASAGTFGAACAGNSPSCSDNWNVGGGPGGVSWGGGCLSIGPSVGLGVYYCWCMCSIKCD